MPVTVGIMAYNEERTVRRAVRSILDQEGPHLARMRVTLVASGCTDRTVPEAEGEARGDPRFAVVDQERREGKAAAIGALLERVGTGDVVVLAGADGEPEPGSIEALVAPFDDPRVGMTGGRPVPVNDPKHLLGRVVRLLWSLHHRVALESPKLGELVAFRSVFGTMPRDTSVDEAAIEGLVESRGLALRYVPEARVRMKGPTSVGELLEQRRRIHAGHLRLARATGHRPSTMGWGSILRAIRAERPAPLDLVAAASLEAIARLRARLGSRRGGEDAAWKPLASTKDLSP